MKTHVIVILIAALLGCTLGYGFNAFTVIPEQNTQNQQLDGFSQQLEDLTFSVAALEAPYLTMDFYGSFIPNTRGHVINWGLNSAYNLTITFMLFHHENGTIIPELTETLVIHRVEGHSEIMFDYPPNFAAAKATGAYGLDYDYTYDV